jgi:hypothetical protein
VRSGAVIARAVISASACFAPRIREGMNSASGRLREYCGISDVIVATLSRAGLKIDAK